MKMRGIDISRWQGDFDLGRAKSEGFEFAIIKAGGGDDGLYQDSKFERNYSVAKSLSMPVGAYFFSRALSAAEAVREADYFAGILAGKQFELPVYMDVENARQIGLGKRAVTDIVKAFCNRMEDLGYWVGIYSSLSYFADRMYDNELQDYAHWVAQWSTELSYPAGNVCGMWQYGGETNYIRSNQVAGQTVDQDYMLIDYPTQIKATGRNGFGKTAAPAPAPVPVRKSVDQLAKEVLAGEWGNGQDRVNRLTAAGYDYDAVQAAVNNSVRLIDIDAYARKVIRGEYGNGNDRRRRLAAEGLSDADIDRVQDRVNDLL